MMDWLHTHLWRDGRFAWWEIVGWTGNLIFSTRIFIQWYATEKKKRVVIPMLFWWLSLAGSLMLLTYALVTPKRSLVFIFAYAFSWIPYVRNIMIHQRDADAHLTCPNCGNVCPPKSNFCPECGGSVLPQPPVSHPQTN
jgi:lipid-A-disaccharide synthase-like uncharacterized protein